MRKQTENGFTIEFNQKAYDDAVRAVAQQLVAMALTGHPDGEEQFDLALEDYSTDALCDLQEMITFTVQDMRSDNT